MIVVPSLRRWAANLGKDLGTDPTLVVPPTATIAAAAAVELPPAGGKPEQAQPKLPGSRQELEAAVLDKAQNLFKFIQSKLPNNQDFGMKDQKLVGILEASKKAEAGTAVPRAPAPASDWGKRVRPALTLACDI